MKLSQIEEAGAHAYLFCRQKISQREIYFTARLKPLKLAALLLYFGLPTPTLYTPYVIKGAFISPYKTA